MEGTDKVLSKYLDLMTEVKQRLETIWFLLNADHHILVYPPFKLETMYFNLRKILEIIVMSPIIVNEKEYRSQSKKPEFDWRIDQIKKNLTAINPNYYPEPTNYSNASEFTNREKDIENNFFTIHDLEYAYGICSNKLHVRNPLNENDTNDIYEKYRNGMDFIFNTINKVESLLFEHIIQPVSNGHFYHIILNEDKKAPQGYIWKQFEPTKEEQELIKKNNGVIPESILKKLERKNK